MADLIKKRRQSADSRLSELQDRLESAESQLLDRACVYVTGSFGRREASGHSDLDLFIAGRTRHDERALPPLDEILVKADLIKVTRDMGFQDFSGDGEYLVHYSVDKLIHSLGTPEDDAAKHVSPPALLLLLESRPLLGADVYSDVLSAVVSAYWRDYDDHKNEFLPAFLVNDILRLWRTFCVNYEARTQTEPAPKKAKRKLKNYKLKHSRLLTCYSALAYLLAEFANQNTVAPAAVEKMARLTPTERLESLSANREAERIVTEILSVYGNFLAETDAPEHELVARFMDPARSIRYTQDANRLGDHVFDLLGTIGGDNPLHRLLVV